MSLLLREACDLGVLAGLSFNGPHHSHLAHLRGVGAKIGAGGAADAGMDKAQLLAGALASNTGRVELQNCLLDQVVLLLVFIDHPLVTEEVQVGQREFGVHLPHRQNGGDAVVDGFWSFPVGHVRSIFSARRSHSQAEHRRFRSCAGFGAKGSARNLSLSPKKIGGKKTP